MMKCEGDGNGANLNAGAEALYSRAKAVWVQQTGDVSDGRENVAPGRFTRNAKLYGGASGFYAGRTLRSMLENIGKETASGRVGGGRVKKEEDTKEENWFLRRLIGVCYDSFLNFDIC